MCDRDTIGAPATFKLIRSVAALARILPILALRWAENAARLWMDSFHEEMARKEKNSFFSFSFSFSFEEPWWQMCERPGE